MCLGLLRRLLVSVWRHEKCSHSSTHPLGGNDKLLMNYDYGPCSHTGPFMKYDIKSMQSDFNHLDSYNSQFVLPFHKQEPQEG